MFGGIVMNGTATVILGNLPNFVRVKRHFPRVVNISNSSSLYALQVYDNSSTSSW